MIVDIKIGRGQADKHCDPTETPKYRLAQAAQQPDIDLTLEANVKCTHTEVGLPKLALNTLNIISLKIYRTQTIKDTVFTKLCS